MRKVLHFAALIAGLLAFQSLHAQQTPPTGTFYKFRVKEDGIYSISVKDLRAAGLNTDAVNPANIHVVSFRTGMLPQANNALTPGVLASFPIKVTGAEDGKFNNDDRILFYGQGPDAHRYFDAKGIFDYSNNLYSDYNYYFVFVSTSQGQRIGKSEKTPTQEAPVTEYVDYGYYETDKYNDLKSGRDWFGEQFDVKNEITIRFEMPGIVSTRPIRFVSNLMAQSYQYSSFKIFWNKVQILDRKMDTIPQTTYGPKGTIGVDTLSVNASTVGAPPVTNQDIRIQFTKGGGNRSVGYLNYILLTVPRKLSVYQDITFATIPAQTQSESDLLVENYSSDIEAWNVSDPLMPAELTSSISGTNGRLRIATTSNQRLVFFREKGVRTPEFVGTGERDSSLYDVTPALLIVSAPQFAQEAERLAAHRRSAYGISVKVVTTEQVYDEFSGGRQDITAIRNYIRYLYRNQQGTLRNVLLFGRGSYDYKNRVFNNSNYVPIYQSRSSLHPLETYSSDDYYGFLEDNEGEWPEQYGKDHTLDIGVGRLPVTTSEEAKIVVDKLIAYDNTSDRSSWRQRVLFVADDGDWNIHQSQAEDLSETFELLYKNYHTSKLYLDAFEQQSIAAGQVSPKAREALERELNKGYDIVNYTGHGSERVWMQERILDQDTPLKIKNTNRLPVFLTATCEFGRHDDPLLKSTGEMLLLRKGGGAIALVTTSRPVNTITNSVLNRAFYSEYFSSVEGVKDLGSVFRQTKNKSMSGVANRNFSLLGDPSMRFDSPRESVIVTSLTTSDGGEQLQALSNVMLTGEVQSGGQRSTTFDGEVEVEVFDRRSEHTTLGDENAPFTYRLWDHSLFRGKARVVDGEFAIEFTIPKGVSAEVKQGKMTFYAYTPDGKREAQGAVQNIKVGGVSSNPTADVSGPSIELFMGDSTFVDGGYANSDTKLVGKLSDKSGINISGYGDGNLLATLDGKEEFIVNDFFVANTDDPTTGWFSFPISELESGQHTIAFKAADNHGNLSTASISFIVGEDGALVIGDLGGYPNPFSESQPSSIQFTHNRAGEDLQVQVSIFDVLGQLSDSRNFEVPGSSYRVTLFDWNGLTPNGTKLVNGIYFVKVAVRSGSDGAKNGKIAKLILTN